MKKQNNLSSKVITSLLWKFLERIGTQGIQFVVSIILARLLLPDDYGVVTMILVFTSIANVFIQTGFSISLVQKKDADELDFSSVFYVSIIVALICYIILFVAAPYISKFYNMPEITSILRVISISLFFGAISSIQNAKISKEMQFKKLFFSSLGAILVSGATGIIMAYKGYGPWALVGQQLSNEIVTCIILWFTCGWRPKAIFSIKRVKTLLSFGWKILCSSLLDSLYRNIYNLTIGKVYSSETLGNYNKGEQFPKLIAVNVDNTMNSVMMSAFSKEQDRKDIIKKMVRRTIKTGSLIMFPMMFGLAAISETIVKILLTDKWIGCVPYMQLLCIVYALYPINSANMQAIKALGRSDYSLKIEIIKKVFGIAVLALTLHSGVLAMTIGQVIVSLISAFISAFPNRKLINYKHGEMLKDLIPSLILSIIMSVIVYSIKFININQYVIILMQIIIGVIIYFGLAYMFKLESFNYLLKILKRKIKRKQI